MTRLRIELKWRLCIGWFVVGMCAFAAAAQAPRFGLTVAGITIGRDGVDKARSLYGQGAEQDVDQIRTLCYYFEEDHAYLSVSTFEQQNRIRSLTLKAFNTVLPGCHDAKVSGKHLTGPAGVQLGNSMTTVLDALGKPSKTGKVSIGSKELVYADYAIPAGNATFQFESGKLVLLAVEVE